MTYAAERDAAVRTPQAILKIGVPVCENFYATPVKQLLKYTEDLAGAAWTASGCAPSILISGAVAPDGVTLPSTIGAYSVGDYVEQVATGYAAASATFVFSLFMAAGVATGDAIDIEIRDSTASEFVKLSVSPTFVWKRYDVVCQFTGAATGDVRVRITKTASADPIPLYWGFNLTKNPVNNGLRALFPYVKRVAEADTVVATMASRCQAADAGDGSRCTYTLDGNCQDPENYNPGNHWSYPGWVVPLTSEGDPKNGIRDYRFCKLASPLPFKGGDLVRPMLESWDQAPQEIDASRGVIGSDPDGAFVTRQETVTYRLADDANPGLWDLDKFSLGALVNTAPGGGTFWRRFLAIHPNFDNPLGYAKLLTGYIFAGSTEADYQLRLSGPVARIRVSHDGVAQVEATDALTVTKKKIPSAISSGNVLSVGIDASVTSITVDDPTEISDPAPNAAEAEVFDSGGARTRGPDWKVALVWGTEKMNVIAKTNGGNPVTVQRGRWGTTAIAHAAGEGFTEIRECGTERFVPSSPPLGVNPIDQKMMFFREAGLTWAEIDKAFHLAQRTTWAYSNVDTLYGTFGGTLFRNTITEPTDIDELLRDIDRDLVSFQYVNEARQAVTQIFAPPTPSDTLIELTDISFVKDAPKVETDLEPRLTRVAVAWDLIPGETGDKFGDYAQQALAVETAKERAGSHGSIRDLVLLSRWIRAGDTAMGAATAGRILARFLEGVTVIEGTLEAKNDDNVKLGTFCYFQSAQIQTASGATAPKRIVLCTWKKRDPMGGRMQIKFLDTAILRRTIFFAPDGQPDYDAATEAQKRYWYIGDSQNRVGAQKEDGYYIR